MSCRWRRRWEAETDKVGTLMLMINITESIGHVEEVYE